MIEEVLTKKLDKKSVKRVEKVLLLFMVGELYGLNTLHSILDSMGIKSNNYQKIWQDMSCFQIVNLLSEVFAKFFEDKLISISSKSASTWSRQGMTIIIDGSVFKQWLTQEPFGKYYARYFSGQTHKPEYGFHLVLLGVSIGEDFFPLKYHLIRKDKKEQAKQIASKLLVRCRSLLDKSAVKQSLNYGKIYVSVDSGFRCNTFIEYCKNLKFEPIIAAVKTHKFTIGRWKGKLNEYIEQEYKKLEEAHNAKYVLLEENPPPFVLRIKGWYDSMNREVLLVFFRINHSKKVSVVFTTDLVAKRKTIRRRFFKRVKIEQFFRFVKHTLKIQQSTSENLLGFLKKIALFFFKVLMAQAFTNIVRKTNRAFKGLGFERIRRLIIFNVEKVPLEKLLFNGTFCTDFAF